MKIIIAFIASAVMLFYGLAARSFGADTNAVSEWCAAKQDVPASWTITGINAILESGEDESVFDARNDVGFLVSGTVVKVQHKDSKLGVAAVVPVYAKGATFWVEYPTSKYWDCSFEKGE